MPKPIDFLFALANFHNLRYNICSDLSLMFSAQPIMCASVT